jgi:hypothetical protein
MPRPPALRVITAKDLTDEDRNRLNGGVDELFKRATATMRQLGCEIGKCVKRQTGRVA